MPAFAPIPHAADEFHPPEFLRTKGSVGWMCPGMLPGTSSATNPGNQFEATRWSLVLRARAEDTTRRSAALSELYRCYWPPLYAFLRRSGRSPEDAQDLAQEYFVRLLDGNLLAAADPSKGRFRTLLLASLRHLDANTYRDSRAAKRGGGQEHIALDAAMAEERWQALASRGEPPERIFDRAWASLLIDRASVQLGAEYDADGRRKLFEALFPRVMTGRGEEGLAEIATRLGQTEAAVKMAFSRLRRRFADGLRAEVAHTVGSRDDVQEELRYLLSVLG